MKGWPFDPDADFTCTWERIEKRAGKTFSHKDRTCLRQAGIIFDGSSGRPPDRIRFVYTYWSLYLNWIVKEKRKKLNNT
jgi:hypothetical protein